LFVCTFASSKLIDGALCVAARNRLERSLTYCNNDPKYTKGTVPFVYLVIIKQTMETKILRVVRQGEAFSVQSSKSESGSIQKCNIVLRELGGSRFENEYVCAMLGNLAACRFYEGDVVVATLRFSTHEYQGQTFQEVLATDVVKVNK